MKANGLIAIVRLDQQENGADNRDIGEGAGGVIGQSHGAGSAGWSRGRSRGRSRILPNRGAALGAKLTIYRGTAVLTESH